MPELRIMREVIPIAKSHFLKLIFFQNYHQLLVSTATLLLKFMREN